jgi:hypothetical protein
MWTPVGEVLTAYLPSELFSVEIRVPRDLTSSSRVVRFEDMRSPGVFGE